MGWGGVQWALIAGVGWEQGLCLGDGCGWVGGMWRCVKCDVFCWRHSVSRGCSKQTRVGHSPGPAAPQTASHSQASLDPRPLPSHSVRARL